MFTHVFHTMGTVSSIRAPRAVSPHSLEAVESVFAEYDRRFSLYRADSEASQIALGELRLTRSSMSFRDAYAQSIEWENITNRAFTPYRPDGVLDLSGVVKALAMDAAGQTLVGNGAKDWVLNVGGDLLVHGTPDTQPWRFGIVDPLDRTLLLGSTVLHDDRVAAATSGSAERGDHIWSTPGGSDILQATVIGTSIVEADVLATAIVSGGSDVMQNMLDHRDVDVLAVDDRGVVWASPRIREHASGISLQSA